MPGTTWAAGGSQAIDGGEIAAAPEANFSGNARPVGGGPDIGAIESKWLTVKF